MGQNDISDRPGILGLEEFNVVGSSRGERGIDDHVPFARGHHEGVAETNRLIDTLDDS
jgi:hypothetical protein